MFNAESITDNFGALMEIIIKRTTPSGKVVIVPDQKIYLMLNMDNFYWEAGP